MATNPTISETLAPYKILLKRSLPRVSVPNHDRCWPRSQSLKYGTYLRATSVVDQPVLTTCWSLRQLRRWEHEKPRTFFRQGPRPWSRVTPGVCCRCGVASRKPILNSRCRCSILLKSSTRRSGTNLWHANIPCAVDRDSEAAATECQ